VDFPCYEILKRFDEKELADVLVREVEEIVRIRKGKQKG